MKFDLSQVEFSKKDLVKSIKIPTELTQDLAEIIGLHIGDGYLGNRKEKYEYIIQCMGNPILDKLHYDYCVSKLWKSAFNIKLNLKNHPNGCYGFKVYSKAIGTFLNKALGIPIGKKSKTINLPDLLKNTCKKGLSKYMAACIRGVIDTDFYLTNDREQLELGAWFASRELVIDLKKYLQLAGIEPKIYLNVTYFNTSCGKYLTRHQIRIRRRADIKKWIGKIGTHNPKFYKLITNTYNLMYAPVV